MKLVELREQALNSEVAELAADEAWIADYLDGVRIEALAWGWDLAAAAPVPDPDPEQRCAFVCVKHSLERSQVGIIRRNCAQKHVRGFPDETHDELVRNIF